MRVTITFEIDDKERKAIAAEAVDWDDMDPDLAKEQYVEGWIKAAVRGALTDLLETFEAGGLK